MAKYKSRQPQMWPKAAARVIGARNATANDAVAAAVPVPSLAATSAYQWMDALEHIKEPVFIHDGDYRILRCNRAYAACADMPAAEIVGKPYWQVFPKMEGPFAGCRRALEDGVVEEMTEFATESGEIYVTHDVMAYDDAGMFWYSRHMMENVTAQRRGEQALHLRSSFSDAIIGSAPGIFGVVDAEGNYVRWNAGLNALTGLSDEKMRQSSVWALVPDENRVDLGKQLENVFTTGSGQGEMSLLDQDRKPRDFVYSARRFEVGGTPYVASFIIDKTELKQMESELQREKSFSDAIIESAPGAFYVVDQHANLVRWNSYLKKEIGLEDEELKGRSVLTAIDEQDRSLAAAKILAAFATGYAQLEVRVPTAARGVRTYFKTVRRFFVDGIPYLAGFGIDITERKQIEETLAREKAFSDALIESVPGAFYAVDTEGNYFRWNSYLNRLTGLSDEQLRRTTSLLTIQEDDRPLAAATMRTAFEAGYAQAELRVLTRDRGVRVFFMTARRFQVADSSYLVGVGIDTTDRIARARELEHEARTDPLTGVANRAHFMALAMQEFARARRYGHPLSLWTIDIDRFKDVNDAYGHPAGDIVLQTLVTTSRQMLRDWDILGRMGGEEFAVLLPEADANQALLVAERLRQAVATAIVAIDHGTSVRITVSIGVATQRDADAGFEVLLGRADQALYEAKRTGRDKVCVAERTQMDEGLLRPSKRRSATAAAILDKAPEK